MIMLEKMGVRKVARCVSLIGVICLLFNSGAFDLVKQTNANVLKSDDELYYLDIGNPSHSQPIDPTNGGVEGAKFVQVEVSEVLNPKRYGLTFEVRYQQRSDREILLGGFSLFPADNPGQFIVPTQGKVKNEGTIVLSMVITDKVDAGDEVKVGIKKIRFL